MLDPNPLVAGKGVQMLRDAGIEVIVGVLEKECRELNKRFLCLHEKHRPYVILKWAQTNDGFIDIKRTNGSPLKISTPATKEIVHRMRAENMAIW
jgi:diaminohydroxyphosphoribosylaminopyrimidine deaminase/5-amino-6-(5-phosphoribosylamino)uracil reductase